MENFKRNDKHKDLRLLSDSDREEWLEEHSAYGEKNINKKGKLKIANLHNYFHIISQRAYGVEHYFRPECLEEAAIEVID